MTGHLTTRFLIFCFLAACGTLFVHQTRVVAQPADKTTIRLDLQEMIKRAVAESPEAGVAESDLIAARSALQEVEAAFYPRLESIAIVGPVNDADEPLIVNNRIHDPSPGLSLENIGIFGKLDFIVTQPLYTFGRLSNAKKAASMGAAAQKQEIDKTADGIALQVTKLYYALILARAGVGAIEDAENFFSDARRRINRLLQVNSPDVSQSDLYMIDAFRAGVMRSRVQAQQGIQVATYALRAMLRIPRGVHLEVVPEPLDVKKKEMASLKTLVQQAFSNRPEFKQLQNALKASKYQAAAAVSDLYPSLFVALDASLAGAPGREHFDNAYIPDEFNHADVGVVAGAKWELDFGIKRARIRQARAQYNKLRYTQKRAEMDIPIQIAKAYDDAIEWKESAKIYQQAAIASRKWVVSAFADFDMGIGTADNMLRAIEKYGENQGNYIEALYNYQVAAANLKHATGTIRQHEK